MATCSNCKRTMTCGCQKRLLPDGSQGCTNCLSKAVLAPKAPVGLNPLGPNRYKNLNKFIK